MTTSVNPAVADIRRLMGVKDIPASGHPIPHTEEVPKPAKLARASTANFTFDDVEEGEEADDSVLNRASSTFQKNLVNGLIPGQPKPTSALVKPKIVVKSSIAAVGAQLMLLPGPAAGKKPTTTSPEPIPGPSPLYRAASAHMHVELEEPIAEIHIAEAEVIEPTPIPTPVKDIQPTPFLIIPVTEEPIPTPPLITEEPTPVTEGPIPTPPPLEEPKAPVAPVAIPDTISPTGSSAGTPPPEDRVEASLHGRVIRLEYKKGDVVHDQKEVKTIYAFFAAIMNLFSAIFPCNLGAAKIKIGDETFYVRRSVVKQVLDHTTINKGSLRYDTPELNMSELKASALIHFKA